MKLSISKHLVRTKINDKGYVIYHSLFGGPMRINNKIWDIIQRFKNGATVSSVFNKRDAEKYAMAISSLRKGRYLVEYKVDEYAEFFADCKIRRAEYERNLFTGKHLDDLRFEMSGDCNFNCQHCFAQKIYDRDKYSRMGFGVARIAVEGAMQIMEKNKNNSLMITYWGWEPLLNWRVMRRIIEYSDQAGKDRSIDVKHGLATNASLLSDEILNFTKKHHFSFAVSLDGLEKDNDRFRKFINGKGTFKSIIRGMDRLKKHGYYFLLELILNDYNFYHIEKFIDFIQNRYKCNIIINPVQYQKTISPFDRHTPTEKAKRLAGIFSYYAEKGININMDALEIIEGIVKQNPRQFFCHGKVGSLYIKPSGTVYPCHKINMPIGSVWDIKKIYQGPKYAHVAKRGIDKIKSCRGCPIEGFCAGGCSGIAEFYSGDIYDTSHILQRNFYCEFRRQLAKETLRNLAEKKDFLLPNEAGKDTCNAL